MAYCDYDFYTTVYMGSVISEADFARLAEKASDKLDMFTFDRLVDGLPADERTALKVKKAVCALAERISDIETADMASRYKQGEDGLLKGRTISSISAGGESISFGNATQNVVTNNIKEREQLLFETAREYLANTGLLYQGV